MALLGGLVNLVKGNGLNAPFGEQPLGNGN
jgi:hypothetical protein